MIATYSKTPGLTGSDRHRPSLEPHAETQQNASIDAALKRMERLVEQYFFPSSSSTTSHPGPIRVVSKRAGPKEVLFFKGDPATHLYVIVSGKVKVSAPSEDGKEITFAILGPGELIGEIGVLKEGQHTATVTALEPTELAAIDRQDVRPLLHQYPAFGLRLITMLCDRLRQTSEIAEDISFLTLPVRLAKKLSALARTYGVPTTNGVKIGLPLCQQELANLVGTTRESINKQLALWHTEGLVSMSRGYLTIHRPEEMATFAGAAGSL